jgi:hypothetical protein
MYVSMAALLHRNPASARMYCGSCIVHEHYKMNVLCTGICHIIVGYNEEYFLFSNSCGVRQYIILACQTDELYDFSLSDR